MVLGYAETATGLGHAVADGLGAAPYLHSTRRAGARRRRVRRLRGGAQPRHRPPAAARGPGAARRRRPAGAGRRRVLHRPDRAQHHPRAARPRAARALRRGRPGRHAGARRPGPPRRASPRELGARIDVVALAVGTVTPARTGVLAAGQALVAAHERAGRAPADRPPRGAASRAPGRPGLARRAARRRTARLHAPATASAWTRRCPRWPSGSPPRCRRPRRRVLVLGFEELMYAPLRLGPTRPGRTRAGRRGALLHHHPLARARRRRPRLRDPQPAGLPRPRPARPTAPGERYAYNVGRRRLRRRRRRRGLRRRHPRTARPRRPAGPTRRAHRPTVPARRRALVRPAPPTANDRPPHAARAAARPRLLLLRARRGRLAAQGPVRTSSWRRPPRSARRRSRAAARTTPSRCPSSTSRPPSTRQLFRAALDRLRRPDRPRGRRRHRDSSLAERGPGAVLVSLARAGTPVGVLMRRWARHAHGLDLPHYAVSIVRGRGIDANALRWLAAHHDPADVVFVDGWTGKGAITRELAAAVEEFGRLRPRDRGARRPRRLRVAPTAPATTSSSRPPASTPPSPGWSRAPCCATT